MYFICKISFNDVIVAWALYVLICSDATKYAELAERKIMDAHQDIFAVETQLRLTRHL